MYKNELKTFDDCYYEALSKVIIELREKNGKTLDDVALLCDLKPNTFYRYEIGGLAMPIPILKKLCAIYNVDMKIMLDKVNAIAFTMIEENGNV